jgi:peptidyl-prolyl cis-trans isomerase D
MLEQMRRSSQSLLIYVLFGIVIAVFIINFGPHSGGCDGGPPTAANADAGKVDGRTLTSQDFRYAYLLMGGGQFSPQMARARRLKETIMDKLIERELLALEAERLGFRVSDEEVEDLVMESKMVGLGYEQPVAMMQKDGKFDYESFRKFALYQLGMSPRAFIEQQRREMLAARVRLLLRGGVNVSADEVKTDFLRRGNQVNVEYVRFSTRRYENEIDPTAKEIEAYAAANETKLKDLYTQRKFLYEKAPKERRLRQILVKLDSGASADAEAAAKKKAEGLAERVRKGESFAAVARAASDDTRTKHRGGDLGWKRQGTTTLGPGVEEKVWAAKDGEVIGPEKGADGFSVVVAEGTREGDLPFEKVKLELAEDQLRQEMAKTRAKADAEAALAKAKGASAKTLKELFPGSGDKSAEPPEAKGKNAKVFEALKKMAMANASEDAPQAEETGLFMRRGSVVEGIGTSAELAKAVFALTKEAPYAGPIEVAGSQIIAKLKERKEPDVAEYEKKKLELEREASLVKGEEVVMEWALKRCQESRQSKSISVNRELLRYDSGPEGVVAYEPCTPPPRF